MRSEAVGQAHKTIPERFALCAIGAKAVRALHPDHELIGTTINRVLWLISSRELDPAGGPPAQCNGALQEGDPASVARPASVH